MEAAAILSWSLEHRRVHLLKCQWLHRLLKRTKKNLSKNIMEIQNEKLLEEYKEIYVY